MYAQIEIMCVYSTFCSYSKNGKNSNVPELRVTEEENYAAFMKLNATQQ